MDYKYNATNWFDELFNLHDLDHDLPFDEYEEYLHTYELVVNFAQLEKLFDMKNSYVLNLHKVINSSSKGPGIAELFMDFEKHNQRLVGCLQIEYNIKKNYTML